MNKRSVALTLALLPRLCMACVQERFAAQKGVKLMAEVLLGR